jgi:hypothetical protein
MSPSRNLTAALAVLTALALTSGCTRPTRDPTELKAITEASRLLMKLHPADADIPRARWPRAIARLEPELVSVTSSGVHITTKAYFDGGWGYFVPRRERALPEPVDRFEKVGQGVYWWHPY